jgi:hypothetical protein
LPLPVAGSRPFPSDEVSDHEAAFSVLMKMLTFDPCVVDAGEEIVPDGCGFRLTVTLADGDPPPHALFAVAWNVVACEIGTTALPIAGRFAPTPAIDTTAPGSEAVHDNRTDSFAQTAEGVDVIVTIGALHGCFTARLRASAEGRVTAMTSAATERIFFTVAVLLIQECQHRGFRYRVGIKTLRDFTDAVLRANPDFNRLASRDETIYVFGCDTPRGL